jgi:hypothetical protein
MILIDLQMGEVVQVKRDKEISLFALTSEFLLKIKALDHPN